MNKEAVLEAIENLISAAEDNGYQKCAEGEYPNASTEETSIRLMEAKAELLALLEI